MKVMVNGEARDLAAGASVADAVAAAGAPDAERGVAVAVDGEVVPRGEWAERILTEGETIEVVHAVQGG
jgi:sulfur carrier protein